MITLAITTYNRDHMTHNSFKWVHEDDRIDEIVIVDDHSDIAIFHELQRMVAGLKKVKLYRNDVNLGCYHNKRRAVELSTNDWVILFDSDNTIKPDYLDALFYSEQSGEIDFQNAYIFDNPNVLFAPSFAKPHFDYRLFAGRKIEAIDVSCCIPFKNFDCLINTCNFVVNRDEYLKVFDQGITEPWTADTLYFNYCWLKAGNGIYVVPGMEYEHLVHDGSHYKENVRKTGNFASEIMEKMKRL